MCLRVNVSKRKPSKNFRVFKVFKVEKDILVTPYQLNRVKAGILKGTGGQVPKNLQHYDKIEEGAIHCYQSMKDVDARYDFYDDKVYVVLPCTVSPQDFIAWGTNGDVAVKKITVPKEFIDKSVKDFQIAGVKKEIKDVLDDLFISETNKNAVALLKQIQKLVK